VRILGTNHRPAEPVLIPELVDELLAGLVADCHHPLQRAAEFHLKFESIQPFIDGNGRTGRLIMFAKSLNLGIVPPIIEKERKAAYYKYLELAQTRAALDPLEQLLAQSIIKVANSF
jgi:Fic family protein